MPARADLSAAVTGNVVSITRRVLCFLKGTNLKKL
jgi:hypothetical protein